MPDLDQRTRRQTDHPDLPPLSDPGKDERAASGLPVVPAFDGYRAAAILTIVVFHILLNAGVAERAGGSLAGQLIWGIGPQFVDVLFIVSGFVVFLPTVAREGDFGSVPAYAIRRAARLFPAYWVALLVMLAVMASESEVQMPGFADLASNFSGQQTLVQFIDADIPIGFGFDLPLWTLTLEIGFYVVLPFIASAYFRRPLLGLGIALAVSLLWRLAFDNIGSLELQFNSVSQLPSWAFSFACGMTGAWAYVTLRERYDREALERWAVRSLVPSLAVFALFVLLAGRKSVGSDLPTIEVRDSAFLSIGYTASLAAVMMSLALSPLRLQAPFAHPLARKLGDISYGVYLIQAPIFFLFVFHTGIPEDGTARALGLWLLAVIPASLLYGYASARFIEQPIRRWARRYGRRAQPEAPDRDAATPAGTRA